MSAMRWSCTWSSCCVRSMVNSSRAMRTPWESCLDGSLPPGFGLFSDRATSANTMARPKR